MVWSYHGFILFRKITTRILQSIDPTCSPRWAFGSDAFPFVAPFQRTTSFECVHRRGIVLFSQILVKISLSSASYLAESVAYLRNSAGISFDALPFLRSVVRFYSWDIWWIMVYINVCILKSLNIFGCLQKFIWCCIGISGFVEMIKEVFF